MRRGLESLSGQDLSCWDPQQLAEAWPLLGQPLDKKDGYFSKRMYEKLTMAGGFDNYYQVGGQGQGQSHNGKPACHATPPSGCTHRSCIPCVSHILTHLAAL